MEQLVLLFAILGSMHCFKRKREKLAVVLRREFEDMTLPGECGCDWAWERWRA
jgi:hypothetical protein